MALFPNAPIVAIAVASISPFPPVSAMLKVTAGKVSIFFFGCGKLQARKLRLLSRNFKIRFIWDSP